MSFRLTPADVLRLRRENHALARATFRKPEDVVEWFGAIQAQDYLGALWAIGLRMRRATEASVEAAESQRAIIRQWPMRGTLHFVAAADAKWLTRLLAPRVIARNAARIAREVDVDARLVARCREIVGRALEGGRRLERNELYAALESQRVRTDKSRGLHILGWLAQEGTLCLAGRSGKQHTFALLDEWVGDCRVLEREAALAALAHRYFRSHGPATLHDFVWWTGLTVKDAQAAIAEATGAAPDGLERVEVDGIGHWWAPRRVTRRSGSTAPDVKLLPAFDEYTVAYDGRASLLATAHRRRVKPMQLLNPVIVVDGVVAGTWRRTLHKDGPRVIPRWFGKPSPVARAALQTAIDDFVLFLKK